MDEALFLHIPSYGELWYRQRLLQDAKTMDYNKGYDLDFDGYDQKTGCIAFPEPKWAGWYDFFIGREPERFYAYIARETDGAFLGEVNLHRAADGDWHEMGIVLEARHRGRGYAAGALRLLLAHAFEVLGASAVRNTFEAARAAALRAHLAAGFVQTGRENGVVELTIPREAYFRERAVGRMTRAICDILSDRAPSIYLHGSAVLGDFRLGWSDLDLLVLTGAPITQPQADALVTLRQELLKHEPGNPYYRSFEGGMLTLAAFCAHAPDRVVYWGTGGQRITDRYFFDSLSAALLLERGRLLFGADVREQIPPPAYADLHRDIARHCASLRECAQTTGRDLYAFGWLLDLARGIYTLRTGTIAAKTWAGQWALEQGLCPDADALRTALRARKDPMAAREDAEMMDFAQTLGPAIQRFAGVLERELHAAE